MPDSHGQPLDDMTGFVPSRAQDGPAMRELARNAYAMYVERIGREPAPMTADYAEIAESGGAVLAWREGILIGMLVARVEGGALLIDNIAVAPDAQGSGLGSALLLEAERVAREAGAAEVRLYTNEAMTENLAFYGHRGFIQTHRAVVDGFRRVFLSKRIAPGCTAPVTIAPPP
ncbi:MAG TPA: GNAT family N-acetyltransferase [Pseudolysinimonas sp.]